MLAEIGKRLGRKALEEVAQIVRPETILGWHRKFFESNTTKGDFADNHGNKRLRYSKFHAESCSPAAAPNQAPALAETVSKSTRKPIRPTRWTATKFRLLTRVSEAQNAPDT
jgi:hypothetical protein